MGWSHDSERIRVPHAPGRRSVLTRRTVLAGGITAVALAGSEGVDGWLMSRLRTVPLHTETAALSAPGLVEGVPRGRADLLVPGTRILRRAEWRTRLLAEERAWLDVAAPWLARSGDWADAATDALLDLRILGIGLPAPTAGFSHHWRYVWPRDLAHVCAALAAVGHVDAALSGLRFLQFVQPATGTFEARYRPDGTGPPDGRHPQTDGLGWALWGAAQVIGRMPERDQPRAAADLRQLLRRATLASLVAIDTASGLPDPSPDYWELPEDFLTLGTAAPLLSGLHAAPELLTLCGETTLAHRVRTAASVLDSRVHDAFGRVDYARSVRGGAPDSAMTFLLPPYAATASPSVVARLAGARREMARPAGGLAPGADWPSDGVSWTPETALFALADASRGAFGPARDTLRWVADHRTDAGSYPEKVLSDGSPAEVAPLAWTAALVVLTVDALTR